MRIGMLWFDDSNQRDLAAKVDRAANHYHAKYGMRPNICYVHPSMLIERAFAPIAGLEVRPSNTVLPGHLWLGREEAAQERPAA